MSSGKNIGALALLPALLAGCTRSPRPSVPAIAAQAPSLPPTQMAALVSPVPPPVPVVWAPLADRNAIGKQIDETENALHAIRCPLSAEEQKTVAQIRTYITRAREGLQYDDLDGGRTLSTKAHVLLLDLIRRLPSISARSGQGVISENTGDALHGEFARQGGETQPERCGS